MSDLDRFELFTLVAETGSLTQAAKNLQLTKASLSKHIKKLEIDLRVNLFSRSGQRLRLTDQGEILLQQCLRLRKELEDTRTICQSFHEKPKGTLHIVALDFFAKKIIYPRLNQFMQKYPELEIFIDTSERIPDFEREQTDIALGFSLAAPNPINLIQRRMATTRHVMCAAPAYLKKHGQPKKLTDLLNHQYIGHSARPEISDTHLKSGYKLKIKPTLVFNNVEGMIECATAGLGIVQLPFYLVQDLLKSKALVEILSSYQAPTSAVYYFYPKFRHTQPKIRCFIDFFLKNYFADFSA